MARACVDSLRLEERALTHDGLRLTARGAA
jgi:hypothetical protein